MNARSLGFRLVLWYASLLTIVFALLSALTLIYLRHYLEANLLDSQAQRAQQIAGTLLAGLDRTGERALAKEVEELYSPAANERFIRIMRSDGLVLYASGKPVDNTFDPSRVPVLEPAGTIEYMRKESVPGGTLLIATLKYPAVNGRRSSARPGYIVEVGASNERTETTLRRVLLMLGVGLPVAVSIAVGGGFALVRRALKPVESIAQKAEAITQHNLSERLPLMHTGDELERLSLSLNRMIGRLEEAIQSSKRFVADASHELRTPLTVLRGELEGLAPNPRLGPEIRERVSSMLEEVDRLAEIVEGLLALSRLDAGEGQTESVRFNLADLALSTADQMGLLAEDKHITLIREGEREIIAEGDRARLKQVVVNLLDNAIKYTPSGGSIRLRVAREDGCAILDVVDDGIGIPPEALPHVFERFYRVDDSRSRTQGGVGLGLSIVQSICAAHRVTVEVDSFPGHGSRFRLKFPPARNRPRSSEPESQ